MTEKIRIKVIYKNIKLVLPISIKGTIKDLCTTIQKHYNGLLREEIITIPELLLDGFILNPDDEIKDVVRENDTIFAYSQDGWLNDQLVHIESKPILFLLRKFKTEETWIQIGSHSILNKIYVRFGSTSYVYTPLLLYFITPKDFENTKTSLIKSIKSSDNSFHMEAKYIFDENQIV